MAATRFTPFIRLSIARFVLDYWGEFNREVVDCIPEPTGLGPDEDWQRLRQEHEDYVRLLRIYEAESTAAGRTAEFLTVDDIPIPPCDGKCTPGDLCSNAPCAQRSAMREDLWRALGLHLPNGTLRGGAKMNAGQQASMAVLSLASRDWYITAMSFLWETVDLEDLLDQCTAGFDPHDRWISSFMISLTVPAEYSANVSASVLSAVIL